MRKLRAALVGGALALFGATFFVTTLSKADAAIGPQPRFQMPFPCGQAWNGNNPNSSAHRTRFELDFNRGSRPDSDLGDTVVAAAAGTVVTSAHQGSANGYGNLIVIQHAGGWKTYYAHLNARAVAKGARVAQGQRIGTVGRTSRPGSGISPHLHYEVRVSEGRYPNTIRAAVFNGTRFPYPAGTVTSRNGCAGGNPGNPHDAVEVCGQGFRVIDQAALPATGARVARVFLLYNADGRNCVATIKETSIGTATPVSAYLEVKGEARDVDSGSFEFYAGPVRAPASNKCVKWGGSAGAAKFDSPFEHCG